MRIVIHTGMHKTATTSVQQWMREHASALEAEQIRAFPLDTKIFTGWPQLFDADGIRADIALARSDGMGTLLYSHEAISNFTAPELQALRDVFHDCQFRFVTVFRHWSGFWPARWAQNCRRRDSQSLFDFIARSKANEARFDVRFDHVLSAQKQVENVEICAVSYDRARQAGNVVRTVLEACGVGSNWLDAHEPGAMVVNPTPNARRSDVIRLFNAVLSDARGLAPNKLFDVLGGARAPVEFFDIEPIVARLLDQNRELAAVLDDLLEGTSETTILREDDFRALQLALDAHAVPVLFNSGGSGSIFAPIADAERRASHLALTSLPPGVRARMVDGLREMGAQLPS